jgi:hypothetical protein
MARKLSLFIVLIFVLASCAPANLPPDGTTIPWAQAVELLHNGQVTMVAQLHSGEVRLTLFNGAEVSTTSPYLDAIFDEVQACGEPCADIVLAME